MEVQSRASSLPAKGQPPTQLLDNSDPHGKLPEDGQMSSDEESNLISKIAEPVGVPDDSTNNDEEPDVYDFMYPYYVSMDGTVSEPNHHIERLNKAHVIHRELDEIGLMVHSRLNVSDIFICKLDMADIGKHVVSVHALRYFGLLATLGLEGFRDHLSKQVNNTIVSEVIKPTERTNDKVAVASMVAIDETLKVNDMLSATFQLRARVTPCSPLTTDNRPTFDLTEQRHIQDVFILKPYIAVSDNYKSKIGVKVENDPLAFGLSAWAETPSFWDNALSRAVPFKNMLCSTHMLMEIFNRRTILSGIENPDVAWRRMVEILERSPSFSVDLNHHLVNEQNVMYNTLRLAHAMVSSRPWYDPAQSF